MAENWDFAIKQARGEFVTIIGDDDGFVRGALKNAMEILEKYKQDALIWKKAEYCWPDYLNKDRQNWMSIPKGAYSLKLFNGKRKLKLVMKGQLSYNKLPCLYNGIVKREMLDKLRSSSTNSIIFNAIAPDVFSGIVLSRVVGFYLYTNFPFSVNGASRHSIGTSYFINNKHASQNNIQHDDPSKKFLAENNVEYDQILKMSPSITTCVYGEYKLAKKFLPVLNLREPNWQFYIAKLISESQKSYHSDLLLTSARHTIKILALNKKIRSLLNNSSDQVNIGFTSTSLDFIAPSNMVKNIHESCELISGMLSDPSALRLSSPVYLFTVNLYNFIKNELKELYQTVY